VGVVLEFKSKAGLKADEQVEDFIGYAKSLTAYDRPDLPLDWESNNWATWKTAKCNLCSFLKAGVSSAKARSSQASDEYFLNHEIRDFAKAYIRYHMARTPKRNPTEIMAVRMVEMALLEMKERAVISLVDEHVLNHAASLTSEYYPGLSYAVGGQLERLAKFLTEKQMVEFPLLWKSPIKRKRDISTGHVSRKADASAKMPDDGALNALAEIFALRPAEHRDIVTTSMVGLLVSAPSRISELLELPANCLIKEWNQTAQKNELMLRFHAKKGGGFMKKAVPEVIASVTEEAVSRLLEITEGPRKLAKFLEEHPDEFPRHDRLPTVGQDTILESGQACDALCLSFDAKKPGAKRSQLRAWLVVRLKSVKADASYAEIIGILNEALEGLPSRARGAQKLPDRPTLTLRKLNTVIRRLYLPEYFPYTTPAAITKYSDALLCFFYNQLNTQFEAVRPYSLQSLSNNWLNNEIGVSSARATLTDSIFERWGYKGEHYRITSHQFRHYLNTLAHRGQAGELEIARWSGRASIGDNVAYNHMSDDEYLNRMREVGLRENNKSDLLLKSKKNLPITLAELEEDGDRIAHVTLYGACVHDFSIEPCQKHRDCLNCREHRCIKGDDEKLKRIKKLRRMIEVQLENALEAVGNEYLGADRWLQLYRGKLERANHLVEILESPDIEDGAVISMGVDVAFSPIKRVLAEQCQEPSPKLPSNKQKGLQGELSSLRKLLSRK